MNESAPIIMMLDSETWKTSDIAFLSAGTQAEMVIEHIW